MTSVEGIIDGIFEDAKQFGQGLNMYEDMDKAIFDVFIWALNENGLLEDYVREVIEDYGIGGPYEYFRNTGYLSEFLGNYDNGIIPTETPSMFLSTQLTYLPQWPIFEELSTEEDFEDFEDFEDNPNDNLAFEP